MPLTGAGKILLALNILIVACFGWYYSQNINYEFLAYIGAIIVILALLFGTLRYTKFPTYIIAGITLWSLLHMLGGSVTTSNGVLYAYKIYPFFDGGGELYILKFDQVIHAFLYGIVALIFLHLLRHVIGVKRNPVLIAFIAVFASAGFSIINEIIEFSAVLILPETGVGGYINTVLDLIFNLGGAMLFVLLHEIIRKKKERTKKSIFSIFR